ncbi:MAG: hypothetical protein ACRDK4_15340 [Solirubrobacteraceae bacterium]
MNKAENISAEPPMDRAVEATLKALEDPDRYPSGTSFLAADLPSFDAHFRRITSEGRPIVVVLPDGEELLLQPGRHRLARGIARLLKPLLGFLGPRSSDSAPLVGSGAPGEPFEVPLMRLSAVGYEASLHGLRR